MEEASQRSAAEVQEWVPDPQGKGTVQKSNARTPRVSQGWVSTVWTYGICYNAGWHSKAQPYSSVQGLSWDSMSSREIEME